MTSTSPQSSETKPNQSSSKGVLLVNLGTPDEATPAGVKRFLKQFLSDKRVVDTSRFIWYPLLNGVILPLRSSKVAKVYQQVWLEEGSPLMVYSQRQASALQQQLNMPVEVGMTYGQPSIASGVDALLQQGCQQIIVLPLYPQYSGTTTAAANDALMRALQPLPVVPNYCFIRDYHDKPSYIRALANQVRQHWQQHGQGDYLLCSYHGILQRYADDGDVYPIHCERTTKLLAQELGLDHNQIGMTYQSRFGREEWLKPYTEPTLQQLAKQGFTKLDVVSPAFSVDCIETLEEIALEGRETYQQAGGGEFRYIACLNDSPEHIAMMVELVLSC